jgi:hypothetical protein
VLPRVAWQWQTIGVPAPLSILITFGVIACLAIVLRWTYGSDASERHYPPPPGEEPAPPRTITPVHDILAAEAAGEDLSDEWATLTEDEGYGLLRTVLATDDAEQASVARAVLRGSGIRCTTTTRPDGRTAVLVFAEQLDQARRLVG